MKSGDKATEKISALAQREGIHAVLFYGAEGAPLHEAAITLAHVWLCASPKNGQTCGVCKSCLAAQRGQPVDLKTIAPQGKSSLIRIQAITDRKDEPDEEAVQSLQNFFRTQPMMAARKVVAIFQADRMNRQAANALLKILEEPHPYAKLVLTTNALGEMLPTVLSRCVNVPIELPIAKQGGKAPTALEKEIDEIARNAGSCDPLSALWLSERFREASGKMESKEVNARAASARAAFLLTAALLKHYPDRPQWAQAAIEAHRRIVGNASSIYTIDALFTNII